MEPTPTYDGITFKESSYNYCGENPNIIAQSRNTFVCFRIDIFHLKICFCQQYGLGECCVLTYTFKSDGYDFCGNIFKNDKMLLYYDSQFLEIGGTY